MTRKLLTAFACSAALLAAMPVHALSCLRPDAVRLYTEARDSTDPFAIVRGVIHADGPLTLPERDADGQFRSGAEAINQVRMIGERLGSDGFTTPFDETIALKIACVAVWCGNPQLDTPIIAALDVTDHGLMLWIGPCGVRAMPASDADVARVVACHQTGQCAAN